MGGGGAHIRHVFAREIISAIDAALPHGVEALGLDAHALAPRRDGRGPTIGKS